MRQPRQEDRLCSSNWRDAWTETGDSVGTNETSIAVRGFDTNTDHAFRCKYDIDGELESWTCQACNWHRQWCAVQAQRLKLVVDCSCQRFPLSSVPPQGARSVAARAVRESELCHCAVCDHRNDVDRMLVNRHGTHWEIQLPCPP